MTRRRSTPIRWGAPASVIAAGRPGTPLRLFLGRGLRNALGRVKGTLGCLGASKAAIKSAIVPLRVPGQGSTARVTIDTPSLDALVPTTDVDVVVHQERGVFLFHSSRFKGRSGPPNRCCCCEKKDLVACLDCWAARRYDRGIRPSSRCREVCATTSVISSRGTASLYTRDAVVPFNTCIIRAKKRTNNLPLKKGDAFKEPRTRPWSYRQELFSQLGKKRRRSVGYALEGRESL